MTTNGTYTHRGTRSAAQTSARLVDALENIKQEFDVLQAERDVIRAQRDQYESQISSQMHELSLMQRSLYDLQGQHEKLRQQYDDEVRLLRAEISALRQAGPLPPNTISLSSQGPPGIPGFHPLPGLGTPRQTPISDSFPREHEPDRTKEKVLTAPETSGDWGDRRTKTRDMRENERTPDIREPKRSKTDPSQDLIPPLDADSASKLPPAHVLYPSAGPSSQRLPPPPRDSADYQVTLPPISTSPQAPFVEDLTLNNVPPEFRKEGSDWFAVFNPRIKRTLDISLVHTLIHASVVCCVQFSMDGKYLATGCNRTAQIYDVKTGNKICVLADDSAGQSGDLYIRSVRFSPDGKLLATGAEDRQIRIWDIAKKRIRNIFDGHQQEIYSLDFSLDGRLIVSGSGDKTARIWDMSEGSSSKAKVLTINDADSLNNDAGVTSVAISPNGQLVAAGSLDTIVRIWDVGTGALLERLRGHRDSVYSVAFTPDGRGLVSGSLDKTLKYWDVSALSGTGTVKGKKEGASEVVLKKPGETTGSSPCTMDFVGHKDYVLSVAVSHDGKWVVSGSKDRCVHFWDSHTATLQFMLQGHKNSVISLDVNPTGGILATGSGDSLARIWQYTTIS
ncbi:Transcriptional repressor tup12 [Hypsizygus marmoreus]|uniref:Transcriptional repressor tup12 n=1 Tax=Hypsizygus marmoreus TaxID=39966 RepID=A0A369KFT3_HYPMA|nr:Transcriptional repressor tup12 [Hypsizygus marmoreus]